MEQSYDKPDLDSLTIDWGDGDNYQEGPAQTIDDDGYLRMVGGSFVVVD